MSPSLIRQVWLAPSSTPGHLPDKCLTQESPCAVKATRSGKGKVARSHPSPASDGMGAPGCCEHRASLRRQQPILCHQTGCWSHWSAQSSALAGGCCAGRCLCQAGYKAQTPLPTKQLGPWVRTRHPDPPWLSLPSSRASPSPAGVACSISHSLTNMVKATATSHRGHCGDHQFLMGLSLGLHLCHSTEDFSELPCSQSAPNSPVGPVRIMNQPPLPSPLWPHRHQGWGPPQMSPRPGMWHDSSRLAHPSHLPRQRLLGLYT